MLQRITPLGVLVALAIPHAALAVGVLDGTAPHVYAVTYLYEDWIQKVEFGGLEGFLDNTEQLEGTDAIASEQLEGTDAIPNPSCSPPCTAMTAQANARLVGGGIELAATSHTYANFDDLILVGEPPSQVHAPAYQDGNIIRAEANAAVFDRLTITAPIQLEARGHLAGDMHYQGASDSAIFESEMPDAYFGTGRSNADLVVSLRVLPSQTSSIPVLTVNRSATFGESTAVDEDVSGTAQVVPAGDYLLRIELRAGTYIGTVNGPNVAVQDMLANYGHTASLRLVASDPSKITAASGMLSFTAPEPSGTALEAVAALGLAAIARRRRR